MLENLSFLKVIFFTDHKEVVAMQDMSLDVSLMAISNKYTCTLSLCEILFASK
jgi:hypothetical protein